MPALPGTFIKLDELDAIVPGDDLRIEVRQEIWLFDDAVAAAIESKIRSDPRLDLYHWERTEDTIIYSVKAIDPDPNATGETQQAAISAGVIIAAIIGVAAMFTSVTVYKTVNSPGGKVLSTKTIAVVILAVLYIFSRVKR